jgi:DNA topoisomerase-1
MKPEEKIAFKKKKAKQQLVTRMGIDPGKDWKANYQILPGKEKVVAELKKLAKMLKIFIWPRIWIGKERLLLGI